MLFPLLWAQAPSRTTAALVSAAYFLAASRGLPQGVAAFYAADLWPGLLLWLAASLSFVLVQTVAWSRRTDRVRALRYLVATAAMALPPFGILGWAQPLTATGVLFPGWGWWGVAATVTGLGLTATRHWRWTLPVLAGAWAWSAATWQEPRAPDGWIGLDLELGQSLGRDASLTQHRDLIAAVRETADTGIDTVVLPESALGLWTLGVAQLWQDGLRGTGFTVIAGAAVIDRSGYDNVLVAISAEGARVLYRERMPVPVSMWQPWRAWSGEAGGARAHLFADPAVDFGGARIAPLICYEQLILWPVLQSMLHGPDVLVAVGNGWWTEHTAIVAIQMANATAWARLFDLPLVTASNT